MSTHADSLGAPGDLTNEEREAVETLLYRLADDEFVIAERYTEWQVRSPTLESDLALSNIAQDELGHARLWYDLLQDFEYTEPDLVWERPPGEWHHSTMTELPFEEGDWADTIVRSYLYDVAEEVRLSALEESSYPRIRDRVAKVQGEEDYHREHAENWMERLTTDPDGLSRVQSAVDRLLPYSLTLFAPVDGAVEERIDDLGLRTSSLTEMREAFLDEAVPYLESLGIGTGDAGLPEQYDAPHSAVSLPDATGRDGTHTDHWPTLFEEFTETYHELEHTDVRKIMPDPDEEQ